MWHMVRALRCFRCRSRAGKGRQMAGQLSLVESGNSVNNTDRQKALDAALAQIDRAFGTGSVMKLGSKEHTQVEAITTGSLGLDIALGDRKNVVHGQSGAVRVDSGGRRPIKKKTTHLMEQ